MQEGERRDLPGYSPNSEVGKRSVMMVESVLMDAGLKSTRVPDEFDDGLDLLASPHDGLNVLPAVAALQVRHRKNRTSIDVGRHGMYWAQINLPVFGVLDSPSGASWVDLGEYLRSNPTATTVPVNEPMETLGSAIRAQSERFRATTSLLRLGDHRDSAGQAGAVLSLRALQGDVATATVLRCMLPALQPVACRLALVHLAGLDSSIVWAPPIDPFTIGCVLTHLHEFSFDDSPLNDNEDVLLFGADALYRLLAKTGVSSADVLDVALREWNPDVAAVALHLSIALAGDPPEPHRLLTDFLDAKPNMRQHGDVRDIMSEWQERTDWEGLDFNPI